MVVGGLDLNPVDPGYGGFVFWVTSYSSPPRFLNSQLHVLPPASWDSLLFYVVHCAPRHFRRTTMKNTGLSTGNCVILINVSF